MQNMYSVVNKETGAPIAEAFATLERAENAAVKASTSSGHVHIIKKIVPNGQTVNLGWVVEREKSILNLWGLL